MQKTMSFNDVAIIYAEENDYRIHFFYMIKDEAIIVIKKSDFKKEGWIIVKM